MVRRAQRSQADSAENLAEMRELSTSAGITIVGEITAFVEHPSPSHFLRAGKLDELAKIIKTTSANVVLFNIDLSPGQSANLFQLLKIPSLDRTELILEIFGKRARSREGKLQVELAQLQYTLPRIGGLGTVLSRLGGGVRAMRGPGESELERDRRKIRTRIRRVEEELESVRKHRNLLRSSRKDRRFLSVAIVGYTNSGKSTLLNALTGSSAYVEDRMFATLDPLVRAGECGNRDVLFIDTVGFLRELPHSLIRSFRATLEEVSEADLLLHVVDVSHPRRDECISSVHEVLKEIGAGEKPTVTALNKSDLLDENTRALFTRTWPEAVLVSAKERWGLNELKMKLKGAMPG